MKPALPPKDHLHIKTAYCTCPQSNTFHVIEPAYKDHHWVKTTFRLTLGRGWGWGVGVTQYDAWYSCKYMGKLKIYSPYWWISLPKNSPFFSNFLWIQTQSINCRHGNILKQSRENNRWFMENVYEISVCKYSYLHFYWRNRSIFSQHLPFLAKVPSFWRSRDSTNLWHNHPFSSFLVHGCVPRYHIEWPPGALGWSLYRTFTVYVIKLEAYFLALKYLLILENYFLILEN